MAYQLALPPGFRVRPPVCRGFPHCVAQYPYPVPRRPCTLEPTGSPKFLTLLPTHPALFMDPGRPSELSPKKRSLCVGFWRVKTIAICIRLVTRLSQGQCGLPYGLRGAPCTLHLSCSALPRASSTVATLGMSGWLDLAQPGLSPGKKRQASLGALTHKLTASRPHAAFRLHSKPQPGGDAVQRKVSQALPAGRAT
jgi:hypothetical protein